jgi:hypothetical protein
MKISPDSPVMERRLQRLLLPSRRRRFVAQLVGVGPWWQQSR